MIEQQKSKALKGSSPVLMQILVSPARLRRLLRQELFEALGYPFDLVSQKVILMLIGPVVHQASTWIQMNFYPNLTSLPPTMLCMNW
jgi:hypothetical protein